MTGTGTTEHPDGQPPTGRRALVITCSDRAARGGYADRSGPVLVAGLRELGMTVDGPEVVADGAPVGQALRRAIRAGYALVLTTGGTGVGPRDETPEQTRALLGRELPGVAEAIRAAGVSAGVPTAMLSRGAAGLAGGTVVVNLPGSTGGCRDGLGVLAPVLGHLLEQVRGGDHGVPAATGAATGSRGAAGSTAGTP